MDNLIFLDELSEEIIHEQLKIRYNSKKIYTFVGNILVSVNPYQRLPIFDQSQMELHMGKGFSDLTLSPHIFSLADEAYNNMRSPRLQTGNTGNQVIVISGESGAGKTECCKFIFSYLAFLSGNASQDISSKILVSNPVLEAFGNAKTVRNDNSSRFGKFVKLQYSSRGEIAGAKIEIFLLEKSRITKLAVAEMNYHIFYSLLTSAPEAVKKSYYLGKTEDYYYLNQNGIHAVQFYESLSYARLREAMSILGFSGAIQDSIFKTVASVLHLGNIQFAENETTGAVLEIKNPEELSITAKLLNVSEEKLREVLTVRHIKMIQSPNSPEKAVAIRDAISKAIYSHLFRFLVDTINETTSCQQESSFIGVLDIFGFENFKVNSLEQLCINLANERLQQYFNNSIFKTEQDLYLQEGIQWQSIEFSNNQECLDLIDWLKGDKEKALGLLQILDDECKLLNSTDEGLLQKFEQTHADKSVSFQKPALSDGTFAILHYAGKINYHITSFIDKNQDSVSQDVIGLFYLDCQSDFVRNLFEKDQLDLTASSKSGSKRHANLSVAAKFRNSLNELMDTLAASSPLFIRCLKPNVVKSGAMFTPKVVAEQLKYTGMFETVRIRQNGYPKRIPFDFFVERYLPLSKKSAAIQGPKERCESILSALFSDVHMKKWQVGNQKVFLKEDLFQSLESRIQNMKAVIVQNAIRSYYYRSKFVKKRKAARLIQRVYRKHVTQRRLRETRDSSLTLCRAISNFLAKRYLDGLRKKREQEIDEAVRCLQEAIRSHLAFQRLDRNRRMRAAKQLLEEQEKKRIEDNLYEAAIRRMKFKERADQFRAEPSHELEPAIVSPLHHFVVKEEKAEMVEDMALFGDFDIDISDPQEFSMQEYALAHFSEEILACSFFSKKKPLGHIRKPLPTTFLDLSEQRKEVGLLFFKYIQIYMGDHESPTRTSPYDCVYFIISQTQKHEDLANELYCQILNQMTNNPNRESMECGFQLLALAIVSVLPDEELMDYLIAFIKRMEEIPEYRIISHECMNRLRWASGARFTLRRMPPSQAELKAIQKHFKFSTKSLNDCSVHATISSPTGQLQSISVSYSTKCTDKSVTLKVSDSFGIKPEFLKEFGLVVEYKDGDVNLTDTDYLLDVMCFHDVRSVATHDYYNLVFKRRLWLSKPEDTLSDPNLLAIAFHQIKTAYLDGLHPLPLKDYPQASALLLLSIAGNREMKVEVAYRYILPWDLVEEKSEGEWVSLIKTSLSSLSSTPPSLAMKQFVTLFTKNPHYGSWFSRVSISGQRTFILAVNKIGLSFLHEKTKMLVAAFSYSEIYDLGDSGTNRILLVVSVDDKKKSLQIIGSQARQIELLVKQYLSLKSRKF